MSLNVLVVDDSAVMRAIIIKTLRLSGLPIGEVHQAANGREGLQALDSNWIDLALVDINMPEMNGEEMLDAVRMNPNTISLPVVVVSTEGSDTRIEMLHQKGAEFVHKPFAPEILRDTITSMTGVTNSDGPECGALPDSSLDF
jgi:two-component system, chemotaxis family, chemotaxis protein CheY